MPLCLYLLANGTTTQPNPAGQLFNTVVIFGSVFLVFWLVFVRPQMRKDKDRQALIGSLKKNDRVLTSGGIVGVVKYVDEKEVLLRVDEENKVVIRFAKTAIVSVERPGEEGKSEEK